MPLRPNWRKLRTTNNPMGRKIELDDKEYDVDNLNDKAQAALTSLEFATMQIQEMSNMQKILQRAKNSYIEGLKKEMLSNKAGFLFDNE